jgi:hypothetical protein
VDVAGDAAAPLAETAETQLHAKQAFDLSRLVSYAENPFRIQLFVHARLLSDVCFTAENGQ